MKKRTWISTAVIVILLALCASLWQHTTEKSNVLEVMCKSSVNAALEHFEEYAVGERESDYIAGVAEFRTYMTAYLCFIDNGGSAEYTWCNSLYGKMTLKPETVKTHIPELVEALQYLAEDFDDPNGFNAINVLNNQLHV